MPIIAGVDLGGTAVNYTLIDFEGRFLIEGLCEYPARSVEGPDVCLQQIEDGLAIAVRTAGVELTTSPWSAWTRRGRPAPPAC